jgi:hypothetical protein
MTVLVQDMTVIIAAINVNQALGQRLLILKKSKLALCMIIKIIIEP